MSDIDSPSKEDVAGSVVAGMAISAENFQVAIRDVAAVLISVMDFKYFGFVDTTALTCELAGLADTPSETFCLVILCARESFQNAAMKPAAHNDLPLSLSAISQGLATDLAKALIKLVLSCVWFLRPSMPRTAPRAVDLPDPSTLIMYPELRATNRARAKTRFYHPDHRNESYVLCR
jgi:hypothetical protein